MYAAASPPQTASPGRPSEIPVILVSVDTLRADFLSSYGNRKLKTPNIDAMAQGGTLFFQVNAQVPITLPSHASLLTSTYPFALGVEENGESVRPGVVSLATVLRSRGYCTAAFIGSVVLDRRFGLNQGFDVYDSPFNLHVGPGENPVRLRRPGEEVVHAAIQWLEQNANQPFFLFLHIFDLHLPYPLPSRSFRGSGYEVQLAYVDRVVGGFWRYLRSKGLLDRALVVFTSDHGEGLGEHGEETHSYFIYQSTLWVPLIFHWPAGTHAYAARIDEPASLLDVAPTILQFLGLVRPPQFQGHTLFELLEPSVKPRAREIYSESLCARDLLGCSPLRCLRVGRYKYIEAAKPELYDLKEDPKESGNLYSRQTVLARTLHDRLLSLHAHYSVAERSDRKAASPEALAGLAALGYMAVAEPLPSSRQRGPDPKDRLYAYREYLHAIMLAENGHLAEAVAAFQKVLKEDPRSVLAHYYLGASYLKLQKLDEAVKELQATLALAPQYAAADELLGMIAIEKKDYGSARAHWEHVLTFAPNDYGAHYNLGLLAELDGRSEDAARHLGAAVKADPESVRAHDALGKVYFDHQRLAQARDEFVQAIRLNPKFAGAHYNLGATLLKLGRAKEAGEEFRRALAADPQDQAARNALKLLRVPPARAPN